MVLVNVALAVSVASFVATFLAIFLDRHKREKRERRQDQKLDTILDHVRRIRMGQEVERTETEYLNVNRNNADNNNNVTKADFKTRRRTHGKTFLVLATLMGTGAWLRDHATVHPALSSTSVGAVAVSTALVGVTLAPVETPLNDGGTGTPPTQPSPTVEHHSDSDTSPSPATPEPEPSPTAVPEPAPSPPAEEPEEPAEDTPPNPPPDMGSAPQDPPEQTSPDRPDRGQQDAEAEGDDQPVRGTPDTPARSESPKDHTPGGSPDDRSGNGTRNNDEPDRPQHPKVLCVDVTRLEVCLPPD